MPVCHTTCLCLPKRGNDQADYEDAFRIHPPARARVDAVLRDEAVRVAVADGATESSFARLWADLLVACYARAPLQSAGDLRRRIARYSSWWQTDVTARPLKWYAEEKARMGAFATLLGVELRDTGAGAGSGLWHSFAVGDSCLFQIRDDTLLASFPLEREDQFTSSPVLISSNLPRNEPVWDAVRVLEGDWRAGDEFLLMTDALAAWFVTLHEAADRPWNMLIGLTEDPDVEVGFSQWVNEMRQEQSLRNDDVTFIRVRIG